MASALSIVETALGKSGQSIDGSLDSFFNAFANLAEDPTSANARRLFDAVERHDHGVGEAHDLVDAD